jgi:hypothetical protein
MTLDRACVTVTYLSERKTPAAELFRAGAIRLSLPLTEEK